MKLSVNLPDHDVAFLDEHADKHGLRSRSAVVHLAVRRLRASELGSAYESAWREWQTCDDAALWDNTVGDGLSTL